MKMVVILRMRKPGSYSLNSMMMERKSFKDMLVIPMWFTGPLYRFTNSIRVAETGTGTGPNV